MDIGASQLFIDEFESDGGITLRVVGDLDAQTSSALRYRLQELRRQGRRRIGLDLAHVDHLDSSGVSVLVAEYEECRRTRRSLAIEAVSGEVSKVLAFLGLNFMRHSEPVEGMRAAG